MAVFPKFIIETDDQEGEQRLKILQVAFNVKKYFQVHL